MPLNPVKVTGFVPVTETVTSCGVVLMVPTSWLPNVTVVGLTVMVPGGGTTAPVPLKAIVSVPLDSLMVTVADSAPVVEGVNVTVKVQTTVAGTVCPHVLKSLKSAAFGPLTTVLVMSSAFEPFASETVCDWLVVPFTTDPKFSAPGNN